MYILSSPLQYVANLYVALGILDCFGGNVSEVCFQLKNRPLSIST